MNWPRVLATAGGLGFLAASQCLYTVDAGQRAVIYSHISGVQKYVRGEGLNVILPAIQRRIMFDIRAQPRTVPSMCGTKDLQNVSITLRILYRPEADALPKIYMTLGEDYADRVLPSITNEILKGIVAQFDAVELITMRETVAQKIQDELSSRAKSFGLVLDDIALTHLTFGKEFMEAVELKQVAQQEAEKARYLVEKAEQEKKAAIISAEGDAYAAEILSQAFTKSGNSLVTLRQIEAAEEIAKTLSMSKNVSYISPGQNVLVTGKV